MCEMKKYPPPTFCNAHEHFLINLVEDIEISSPVDKMSMWLVERNLKEFKGFFRQGAHL